MSRVDKHTYYLNIAEQVAARGTCIRRNFGAVIVKNDEIISTGYTGAPRGRENCCEIGKCIRNEMNIAPGQRYEICRSVHAEMNAIISASRSEMMGATLYLSGRDMSTGELLDEPMPCTICERLILNAGISKIISKSKEKGIKIIDVDDLIKNDKSLDGVANITFKNN